MYERFREMVAFRRVGMIFLMLLVLSCAVASPRKESTPTCDTDTKFCSTAIATLPEDTQSSETPTSGSNGDSTPEKSKFLGEFQASYEFQTVPKGYTIPPGLYVRMNLQTGEREARKLRPEELVGVQPGPNDKFVPASTQAGKSPEISEKLPEASEDLPESPDAASSGECREGGECVVTQGDVERKMIGGVGEEEREVMRMEEVKQRIKRKEAMFWAKKYAKLFKPNDDAKTIKNSLMALQNWTNAGFPLEEEGLMEVHLQTIEDLCHQIDNAVDMLTMGGLPILSEIAQRSPTSLLTISTQSLALWALGTATQNNAKVKEAGVSVGLPELYVDILTRNLTKTDLSDNPKSTKFSLAYLKGKTLYALTSLLDVNPKAQEQFWDAGGPYAALRVWEESLTEIKSHTGSKREIRDQLNLARKVVGLIHGTLSNARQESLSIKMAQAWEGASEICLLLQRSMDLDDIRIVEGCLKVIKLLLTNTSPQGSTCIKEHSMNTHLQNLRGGIREKFSSEFVEEDDWREFELLIDSVLQLQLQPA